MSVRTLSAMLAITCATTVSSAPSTSLPNTASAYDFLNGPAPWSCCSVASLLGGYLCSL